MPLAAGLGCFGGSTRTAMTDTKAKVFISHSGWDGIVEKFFAELKVAFGDDFEPLYDIEHITGGEKLAKRVGELIADCDAAVVIIDKRALKFGKHAWVHSEAGRLQDRPVQVIPVLVGGVSPSNIQVPEWQPTGLDDSVAIVARGSSPEQLRELAQKVVDALTPTLKRVRTSKATKELADILSGFPETVLTHAAEKLKPSGQWSERHLPREVAEALIAAAKNDPPGPFGVAMQVLQKLAETDLDRAGDALDIVVPFTWVDGEVAAQIPGESRTDATSASVCASGRTHGLCDPKRGDLAAYTCPRGRTGVGHRVRQP